MSFIETLVTDLQNFDWSDLQDLDTMGVWPAPVKVVIVTVLISSCLTAGYFLHIQNLQSELAAAAAEEITISAEFEEKAILASNLEEYRAQTFEMEESFTELLQQLPSATEVPGLVDDVTDTGKGSGLEILNIVLEPEAFQEFYIELPIDIDVIGDYHDFGTFVSGLASLDRIVTLHDFTIKARTDSYLDMSIVAKTYRYRDLEAEL